MSTGISRLSAADARCQETSGNVRGNSIWITLWVTLGRLLARRAAQRSGLMPASSDGLRAERRRPSTRHGGGRGGTRCRGGRSRQLGAFDRRWCRGRRPGSATTPWLSRGTVVAVGLAGRRQPPRRMGCGCWSAAGSGDGSVVPPLATARTWWASRPPPHCRRWRPGAGHGTRGRRPRGRARASGRSGASACRSRGCAARSAPCRGGRAPGTGQTCKRRGTEPN